MSDDERRTVSQSVVDAAFASLSRGQKQLLLWHRVDELTYGEMAARLGVSREKLIRKMGALVYAWCRAVERAEKAERRRKRRASGRSEFDKRTTPGGIGE
jgi:predicted ArsR family transcriptional regulator